MNDATGFFRAVVHAASRVLRPHRSQVVGLGVACLAATAAHAEPASWFPDPPTTPHYQWAGTACAHCVTLTPPANWRTMAVLAGVPAVRFLLDEHTADTAFAAPPDVVVVSPALLALDRCQQAFVVGHEIAHIARRHYDEDAHAVQIMSERRGLWTNRGEQAMQLLDGDMGLALKLTVHWQHQEREADWLGSLLAAQTSGCELEFAAESFLHGDSREGGVLASHADNPQRLRDLTPFRASARLLAEGLFTPIP